MALFGLPKRAIKPRPHPASGKIRRKRKRFGKKIVFCKGNVMKNEGIEYHPWYLSMFYQQEKEPERFIYEVDLAGL